MIKEFLQKMLERNFMVTIFTLVLLVGFIIGVLSLITAAVWQFILCVAISTTLVYIGS